MSNPSPTELAALTGISVPYASQILSGKRLPSATLALRIEAKAGIPKQQTRPDIFGAPAPASGGGAAGCAPAPANPADMAGTPADPEADADTSMAASSQGSAAASCGSAANIAPQQINDPRIDGGRPC